MKFIKRWLVLLVLLLGLLVAWFVLSRLGILPTYQCGSTHGPNGPVNWCGWYRGIVVG